MFSRQPVSAGNPTGLIHTQSSGREVATGANVLVSIFLNAKAMPFGFKIIEYDGLMRCRS